MIKSILSLLLVISFGSVAGQSDQQRSMADMGNLIASALVSGDFDTVSQFLPNRDDVNYYVDVAVDLKPEVFGEPANRQRLKDRFTDHSHQVAKEFRSSFDSISIKIRKDSLQFREPLNPETDSYTEAGITEGSISLKPAGASFNVNVVVSLTRRGWTWSSIKVTEVTSSESGKQ